MTSVRPWKNLNSLIRGGKRENAPANEQLVTSKADHLVPLYKFYIMQSSEEAKLYASVVEGYLDIEQTTAMQLNEAFGSLTPGGSVMIFFYIESTDYMCGVLELLCQGFMITGEVNEEDRDLYFRFQINWLVVKDVPINILEEVGAPAINEMTFIRRPLKEISTEHGLRLYFSYVNYSRGSSLLDRMTIEDIEDEDTIESESD
uniref:YTH domain-containing protein n=1 Tax=Trichuris muris TaxID=70415 RepID=A0A5S6QAV4_TRIMR